MTTSNTTTFQLTRDDIVTAAYRKLGVIGEGETANATQILNGTQALNTIVASFQSYGMPLWERKDLAVVMVPGQQDYVIGVGKAIAVPFPLMVQQAILNIPPTYSQIDVNILTSYDFNTLTLKAISGRPVNIMYQPFINYGVLSVWPTPDASTVANTTITITYTAPFQYFISAADTMDFPQEWYLALIYGLTAVMAPDYGIPIQDRQQFNKEADQHLATVLSNGGEDGSIFFSKG